MNVGKADAAKGRLNAIKHIFVINPAAGKGAGVKPLSEKIKDACAVTCADYEIYFTAGSGDATSFVKQRIQNKQQDEKLRFYACGGDGTACEVINGAVGAVHGHDGAVPNVEVGCIPIGTGNDFVRNFENRQFFSDITKQLIADAFPIDCYSCGDGRYGLNMINIGFDCEVAARTARYKKHPLIPGKFAYIAGLIAEFRRNKGKKVKVTMSDGTVINKEFQLVSAANGGFCGGGFYSAPRSSLCDGLIDISLIDKVSRRTFLKLVGAYKKGTHLETALGKRVVDYRQAESVCFEFDDMTNICVDGEIWQAKSLTLGIQKKAVNFVIPIGCRLLKS